MYSFKSKFAIQHVFYTSQTNAEGDFEFTFQPLPQEAGCIPFLPASITGTSAGTGYFTLAAMRASDTNYVQLIEGECMNHSNPQEPEIGN